MPADSNAPVSGQPTRDRQVRVFISSTFRDMHAERDHLVTVVFPELRERVEQLGLEFFDVDLRWGVPAKDLNGETANSWEYCRQWIDRVEPFFVCILGQRYGWVPEPRHFRDTTDRQRQEREPRSITDLEVRHAVLDTRRKRRSYFYLRATPVPEPNVEYVDPPEYQGRLEQLKTAVRNCGRPVRDYSPEWTGEGFVGLKGFGDFVLEDLWSGVLRDERYVPKAVWRQVLNAAPDTDPRYTDESQPVPRELWEKIVALAKPPPQDPLDAERQQMEAFAVSRLRWFQGRTDELQLLTDFLHSSAADAPRLAVVAAVPGQGKSALIAELWQKLSAVSGKPSAFLITHFVGATERSATAHALVQRLLDELDRSGIEWPADEVKAGEEPKRDFNSLCNRLAKRLGDYTGERRVVILLDALNQLTDGHDLVWLPHRLGPSVRIVVSCVDSSGSSRGNEAQTTIPGKGQSLLTSAATPEQQVLGALERWKDTSLRVRLGELSPEDVRTIVVEYLNEYCKELDREHVDAICRMEQAKNPLYLLVMLAELRTLGGNDMNRIVGERIAALAHDFPNTVSLFRWVLQRLEVFGQEAVHWWCLYLAYGRVGMANHELANLLARKLDANAAATALLIERGLRRYLLRRGGQLDFFHGQLRQAVMEQYGPHTETAAVHHEIADYFAACAKGSDPAREWETDSDRGFAECVFHLTKAGQYEQAAGLLSTFPFLLHKLRVGLLEGVFEDYDMVRREAPVEAARRLEIWADFFREKAHILRRGNEEWPAHKILLQLAIEHADDSPLMIGSERWLAENHCEWFWLRRVLQMPHAQANPCLMVLEGHNALVFGALEMSDGRLLSWSADHTLRLWDEQDGACLKVLEGHSREVGGARTLSDGRLLSWSADHTLRLWDARSGTCLKVLEGHTEEVTGALALSNGWLLSWSCWDRTLRLWDGQDGECLKVLKGHSIFLNGVMTLSDGRLLSWSADHTLRLWDTRSGTCLKVLKGHTGEVLGALAMTEGRLLSWSGDNTLRLWDERGDACVTVLEGHSCPVRAALALSGGQLLSWSRDKTLRLWDSRSGVCLKVLKGHAGEVLGALALSDGRLLSWSADKSLRLWDRETGACIAVLEGHGDEIRCVLTLIDGRLLSWSGDNTLRLWNGQSGAPLAVFGAHTRSIWGAMVLIDGRLLSWSEDMTLRLWEGKGGAFLKVLEGHQTRVNGALVLSDSRLLSWSEDHTLRLWDGQSGVCLKVLEGHSGPVRGALALTDGQVLSWSVDGTLRLWDDRSGACLKVFGRHRGDVCGALALRDGRLLSWSWDGALRLWDRQSGVCLDVLEGHILTVWGTLALGNGRLLSWSADRTLRLWDGQSGACLKVLEGHQTWVNGALVLSDGRLLSWSEDHTLRLWDGQSGACLKVLEGHSGPVRGALALTDGQVLSWSVDGTLRLWDDRSGACVRALEKHNALVLGALALNDRQLLSWSRDKTLRLWDNQNGACLEVVCEDKVAGKHPEWIHAQDRVLNSSGVVGDFFEHTMLRSAHLRFKTISSTLATWQADSDTNACCLRPDGTMVVTQDSGEVCILKLHHGNRRISLAEAEALLTEQGKLSAVSDQSSVP